MDKLNIIKILGAVLMALGLIIFLAGAFMGKFVMATGFIAAMIAVVLLYYTWQMNPIPQKQD